MTEKIRREWRLLAFRAKLLMVLVVLCCAALSGAIALEDAYIPWGDSRYLGTNDDIINSDFPSWFGSAFKTGAGVWDTNIPAWYVSSCEPNEAALDVLFSRFFLTNSLIVKLGFLDSSNSSFSLDLLLMTNQVLVRSNLFENLFTGSGIDTSRTFNVPLADTNTIGLQFTRRTGVITIRDTLLSPDSDGDGFSDIEESVWGSDPGSALSVPCADITGQVFYAGVQAGVIHVLATTNAADWTATHYLTMGAPGGYTLKGLPIRNTWYPRAYQDVNGNGFPDDWEPRGGYLAPSGTGSGFLVLTGNTAGVDIFLQDPDSDGDGISDVTERALGLNPYLSNSFARLPFLDNFETNTVHLGDVNGQNGWLAGPSNSVLVETGVVWEGSQALSIKAGNTPSSVCQLFTVTNAPVVWADAHILAWAGSMPTSPVSGSAMAFFDDNGYLRVYDGLSASTNKWLTLTNRPPRAMTGEWVRLTMKLDYGAQRWLACVNGILSREGIGFATAVSRFSMLSLKGERGGMDALCVSTNEPAGLSLDGDLMPDDWERANVGNLDQTDDGDPDHDGLSNLEEYRHGTDPNFPDSDHDGMADGWEVTHGFNPTNAADAALDADGDGLSNVAEYQHQSDPLVADSDHDGLTDGLEVNTWHTDPVAVDSDGDGYKDSDEVARGTDPTDATSQPASHWLNHRKLTFREGSLTNRLANVPILVRLTPERIDYTQCAANGRDIFFTDSAGLPLDFEVEKWNSESESLFWVRLPEAGGTNSAGYFWLHWNDPDATNAANAAGVWSTNYLGVWHLAETNTVLADSAPGTYAATNVGAVCVTGILGNARNFRGSDSVIVPPAAFADISNAVSISFWQFGATNQPLNVTCFEGTSVIGRELNAHVPWGDSNVYWDAFGIYDRINKLATTNLYKGGWNHWTFTKDRPTGTMRIYVNGELWHSGTGKIRAYSPVTAFWLGDAVGGSWGFVGMLDEFRVESVAQTPEWVRFQYKAMLDQVLIYGEQQVSIAGTGNSAEPSQPGEFTITRTAQNTNLPLSVMLCVPAGTAANGADFTTLPRSVLIPSGATQARVPVPVMDDLWLEGAETVTVAIAQGGYFINPTNASASIAILDDDVDSDHDGLCDAWEIQQFGNLDATATGDADNDGVSNIQEYLRSTNPHDADTDHDGLPDQWEIAMGTDPLTPDAVADPDHDGLTNLQEYQLGTNPRLADTDGDGMSDGWEVAHELNPLVNDATLDPDNDGLTTLKEYQTGTDPHNPDTDGDGLTDGSEVNAYHTNPLNSDTDGDGLPDKWELDNGTNPLVNDAVADPDGDNLTNMQEYQQGTNPKSADTDGDGIADGVEIQALTDPLTKDFDGPVTDVDVALGRDAVGMLGGWFPVEQELFAGDVRGWVEYSLTAPSDNVYCLAVEGSQHLNNSTSQFDFDLKVYCDGEYIGRANLRASHQVSGRISVVTPWLKEGAHRIRVLWENGNNATSLQIKRLRLQRFWAPDLDGDGVMDWAKTRLIQQCSVETSSVDSVVSPLCIEGKGGWISMMAVSGVSQACHGAGARWYADVPLAETGETAIVVGFQNGGLMVSNRVTWVPVNIFTSGDIVIRKGDTLRFKAAPEGVTNGVVSIIISGSTNAPLAIDQYLAHAFASTGEFTVAGSYSGESETNRSIRVHVLQGEFPVERVCMPGRQRELNCPSLSAGTIIQSDPSLVVTNGGSLVGGGRKLLMTGNVDDPMYMVSRLSEAGPILSSVKVDGLQGYNGGVWTIIHRYDDGDELVEARVILSFIPSDIVVKMDVFVAGVTFDDGTIHREVQASDFNSLGEYRYHLIRPAGCRTSACHRVKVYQGTTYLGGD